MPEEGVLHLVEAFYAQSQMYPEVAELEASESLEYCAMNAKIPFCEEFC